MMEDLDIPRYVCVRESVSCHCCFEFTVLDTKKDREIVCECFEEQDAILITNALNEMEKNRAKG